MSATKEPDSSARAQGTTARILPTIPSLEPLAWSPPFPAYSTQASRLGAYRL